MGLLGHNEKQSLSFFFITLYALGDLSAGKEKIQPGAI